MAARNGIEALRLNEPPADCRMCGVELVPAVRAFAYHHHAQEAIEVVEYVARRHPARCVDRGSGGS
jgi:hypothetical protein